MRFEVTFKTPDVLDRAIEKMDMQEEIRAKCAKFIEYGEYITVEFSDEDGEFTARVVPV